jgi:acyl-CoA thioesterase
MGLEVDKVERGYCLVSLRVRGDMLNGFYILHGGIAFALADSAMAFAANTYGQLAVVTDAHIQFPASAKEGDVLIAEARESARTRKTGYYEVTIKKRGGEEVLAKYQGSVYISSRRNPPE